MKDMICIYCHDEIVDGWYANHKDKGGPYCTEVCRDTDLDGPLVAAVNRINKNLEGVSEKLDDIASRLEDISLGQG